MRCAALAGARPIMAGMLAMLVSATSAAAVSINIGSTSGAPGDVVTFLVSLASEGVDVGGVEHYIAFDPATPVEPATATSACVLHPALAFLSGSTLLPRGCTPLVNCTYAHFIILGGLGSAVPDGFLYQCNVKIATSAPGGVFPLKCSGASAFDLAIHALPVQCVDGQVEVVRSTPTATPEPPVTATPTSTSPARVCSGDCDGNHLVTVDEVLTMVTLALADGAVGACQPGDANLDGKITVDEIVAAVNASLNGCGSD